MLKRLHLLISGRVQGVFFRESTKRKAKSLNLKGWVRNLPDGKVEILAEGEKENLEKLFRWAKKGPLLAKVKKLSAQWQEFQGEFEDFEIRYD